GGATGAQDQSIRDLRPTPEGGILHGRLWPCSPDRLANEVNAAVSRADSSAGDGFVDGKHPAGDPFEAEIPHGHTGLGATTVVYRVEKRGRQLFLVRRNHMATGDSIEQLWDGSDRG